MEFQVFAENAQCVLAHFLAGEKFGQVRGEVQSELKRAGRQFDARVVIGQEQAATCVVLTSAGYPGSYQTGVPISGIEEAEQMESVVIFQAGTARSDDQTVTAGGRVLGVTAVAASLGEATARAYRAVGKIAFEGMHYRRDIGSTP